MRFGVREIADVTYKALTDMKVNGHDFKAGQPVFMIETATASTLEQTTSVVYARGGKGNTKLISWEGEKEVTFTVTDALMSPMGLSILTGAGLINAKDEPIHFHVAMDASINSEGAGSVKFEDICDELGLDNVEEILVCADANVPVYATGIDSVGAAVEYLDKAVIGNAKEADDTYKVTKNAPLSFTVSGATVSMVKLDFYVVLKSGAQTIEITPDSFGGYFYVEADTLFRNEATGKDMAASLVFPKVKVQSAFTFSMAATGDPSTFDFVMDVFPARTKFGGKKTLVDMQVIDGGDTSSVDLMHKEDVKHPVK